MQFEIYHATTKEALPEITKHGIKSLEQLGKDGIIDLQEKLRRNYSKIFYPQELIPFLVKNIYFHVSEPPTYANRVSIMVEESQAEVLNNHIEFQGYETYMKSKMSLLDFLKKSNGDEQLDPISARPINDEELKALGDSGKHHLYCPEIAIQQSCIKEIVRVNIGR